MKISTLTTSLFLAATLGSSLIPAMANPPKPRTNPTLSRRNVTEIPHNNNVQARQTMQFSFQEYIVLSGAMEPGSSSTSRDVIRMVAPIRMIGQMPVQMNFKLTGPAIETPFVAQVIQDTNNNGRKDAGEPVLARFDRHNTTKSFQMNRSSSYLFVTQLTQAQAQNTPYQVRFIPRG